MASETPRPLLNPVLKFTKDPKPEGITGGGKNAASIRLSRLQGQRVRLGSDLRNMSVTARARPQFNGRVMAYAAMYDDSLAPSWTPKDLFADDRGARLVAPFRSGYLIEVRASALASLAGTVEQSDGVKDKVDISRVKAIRFFENEDATGLLDLDQAWAAAPSGEGGKTFLAWLMPYHDDEAGEQLLDQFEQLRDGIITAAPPLLSQLDAEDAPPILQRGLRLVSGLDRFNLALRAYRQERRAVTTVVVPSRQALTQLVASGAVFRLEPLSPIQSTSPGEGREPARPLPGSMADMPVVAVVDGGMTAGSYGPAEAWRAPAFVRDSQADTVHGNRVTSLVVHGHDWNNNLPLPELYCQVGTVQAVPKQGTAVMLDPQSFLAYLDLVMLAYPDTKVWNMSFNQAGSCDPEAVSYLGHGIAMLARKHGILPVISVGNKPGDLLQPPADCEAAITIGGRAHNHEGAATGPCPVSLVGPGPSSMLKPEISHFSNVRVLGGLVTQGSSFATALTSPLAAHTFERLREPTPDLAKALVLHRCDDDAFDAAKGFGCPGVTLPWECPQGAVTLQWTASLRPQAAYYWELPIPPALRKIGKLKGFGKLTAILNPHPLVTEFAGPNYFSARIETALQFQRDGKTHNLLGGLDTGQATEEQARTIDHKWSPVRQHGRRFNGVSFDGDVMKVYARTYVRDLYLYGMASGAEVPPMDVVFVLTLGTGDVSDDIYGELRQELGAYVENAVIETHVELEV